MKTLGRGIVTLLIAVGLVAAGIAPANAYTTTGCDWGTLYINVDGSYANGNYGAALDQAISNYYLSTVCT